MPGNRAVFDRAMEAYRDAEGRADWPHALREALRAAQELPTDLDARFAAAKALIHCGKHAQAVQLLLDLRKRRGNDGPTAKYLAQAYVGSDDAEGALVTLRHWAEQALAQRRPADAIEAWTEAVRLLPGREDVRVHLAELLLDNGDTAGAAEHCVEIARMRQLQGDVPGALEAVDEALGLDAGNRAAQLLRLQLTTTPAPAPTPPMPTPRTMPGGSGALAPTVRGTGSLGTGALRDKSLQVEQLVARAAQQQEAGNVTAALTCYEQAIGLGAERDDIAYSMGLLLQERGEHERAVPMLRRAARNDEYKLSAFFALGQSLRALNQLRSAAEQFEATIALIDLDSLGRAEVDDLITMYEAATACYEELGELARAASLYGSLHSFLDTRRWGKELAPQFKTRAKALNERAMFAKLRAIGTGVVGADRTQAGLGGDGLLTAGDATPPIKQTWGTIPRATEFLTVPTPNDDVYSMGGKPDAPLPEIELVDVPMAWGPVTPLPTDGCAEQMVRYINASARFVEQNLMYAAVDACHEVIRLDPHFLPIHLRLGEVYEREGRLEEALMKYRSLVETYVARDRETDAIPVYYRLVELTPDTLMTRGHLAELLRKAGRHDEAVAQGLQVADALFKMGQTNRAMEEFRRVQQAAPRSALAHKAYGQALLKLERWEAALHEFRQAVQLDLNDLVALAQLNLTMAALGQQARPVWDSLHALMERLRAEPQHYAVVQAEYRAALLIIDTPILHYILGLLQQVGEQHGSAMLSFESAATLLQAEPHALLSPMLVHQALAESLIAQGQAKEALAQLHIVQRLFVEQPLLVQSPHWFARPLTEGEVHRRMAAVFAIMHNWSQAAQELQRSLQFDPFDVQAHTQLAELYVQQRQPDQALAQFEQLATAYEERQQLDQAIRTLERVLKLVPNGILTRQRLARLLIRCGQLDRGIQELHEVSTLQRHAGQTKEAILSMQEIAEVYWMLGQHERVFKIYDHAMALDPADVEVRQQLVNLLIMLGRKEGALREQRRIAQICQQQGNYHEAIASLHQVIALDPDDALTYEQLGDLLMRVQEYDQAVRLFKRLLTMRPGDEHVEALLAAAERMLTLQKAQGNTFAPIGGIVASA